MLDQPTRVAGVDMPAGTVLRLATPGELSTFDRARFPEGQPGLIHGLESTGLYRYAATARQPETLSVEIARDQAQEGWLCAHGHRVEFVMLGGQPRFASCHLAIGNQLTGSRCRRARGSRWTRPCAPADRTGGRGALAVRTEGSEPMAVERLSLLKLELRLDARRQLLGFEGLLSRETALGDMTYPAGTGCCPAAARPAPSPATCCSRPRGAPGPAARTWRQLGAAGGTARCARSCPTAMPACWMWPRSGSGPRAPSSRAPASHPWPLRRRRVRALPVRDAAIPALQQSGGIIASFPRAPSGGGSVLLIDRDEVMAVNLQIPSESEIFPVAGVEIGVTEAGIRKANRRDLTVFRFAPGTSVAGVFTRNRFCAAPVQVCQAHLAPAARSARWSSTPATPTPAPATKACKGQDTCAALGKLLGVPAAEVLPFSTGVILEPLPLDRLVAGLPAAIANLGPDHWFSAAHGIMTTDTLPKVHSSKVRIGGKTVTFTGISKGAGMIPQHGHHAELPGHRRRHRPAAAGKLAREIADASFNRITVDGDTSTNDSFIIAATGKSGVEVNAESDADYTAVRQALTAAALELAQKIVRDAEGATKFMTIRVEEAGSTEEALKVAYAVAHSPLVKTAFFASDPNLGRILAAVGYAGIDDLDVSNIRLWLDDVLVAVNGGRNPSYQEADGQRVMKQAEIAVRIALGRGQVSDTVYTCDFSHEYVSINADYRS